MCPASRPRRSTQVATESTAVLFDKRTKQFVEKLLEVELNGRKTDVAELKGGTPDAQRLPTDGERLAAALTPTARLMVDLGLISLDNAALGSALGSQE